MPTPQGCGDEARHPDRLNWRAALNIFLPRPRSFITDGIRIAPQLWRNDAMWPDEDMPKDASVLLYGALAENEEELEELDLSDFDELLAL